MGQELGRKFKKNFDQYSHIPLFHFPSIPLFHPAIGFTEFQEESFHPCDPQPLAYPPSLFPVPDAEAFPVKPDLKGFDLPPGLNEMAESLQDFMVVNQAEVGPDPFQLDLHNFIDYPHGPWGPPFRRNKKSLQYSKPGMAKAVKDQFPRGDGDFKIRKEKSEVIPRGRGDKKSEAVPRWVTRV